MEANQNATSTAVPIMISKDLYTIIENRVKLSNGEFKNIEDYLTFILTEVVKEEHDSQTHDVYTKEEDEEIKDRLKNLGYI